MSFYNSADGTIKETFTLGKGTNKVSIRSNAGIIETANNDGVFSPLPTTGGSLPAEDLNLINLPASTGILDTDSIILGNSTSGYTSYGASVSDLFSSMSSRVISVTQLYVGADSSNLSDSEGHLTIDGGVDTTINGVTVASGLISASYVDFASISVKDSAAVSADKIVILDSESSNQVSTISLSHLLANATNIYQVMDGGQTASSTILLSESSSVYLKNISGATVFTINASALDPDKCITFEVHISMPVVYSISFTGVTWLTTPDFSSAGTYVVTLRSTNGGTAWLGNLAYKI